MNHFALANTDPGFLEASWAGALLLPPVELDFALLSRRIARLRSRHLHTALEERIFRCLGRSLPWPVRLHPNRAVGEFEAGGICFLLTLPQLTRGHVHPLGLQVSAASRSAHVLSEQALAAFVAQVMAGEHF